MTDETGSYNHIVIEHLKHPRNMGEMENPDGVGEAQNPVCGDTIAALYQSRDGPDRQCNVSYLGVGCHRFFEHHHRDDQG